MIYVQICLILLPYHYLHLMLYVQTCLTLMPYHSLHLHDICSDMFDIILYISMLYLQTCLILLSYHSLHLHDICSDMFDTIALGLPFYTSPWYMFRHVWYYCLRPTILYVSMIYVQTCLILLPYHSLHLHHLCSDMFDTIAGPFCTFPWYMHLATLPCQWLQYHSVENI